MSTASRVGVLGTGAMGSRFARRLADTGHDVHVWNRTRERAVATAADRGITVHDTPRQLAAAVDIAVCMVWDSTALRAVVEGPDGLLAGVHDGLVFVDMSTVEPEVSAEVSASVTACGGLMLDAPVSGSLDAAEAGTVLVMAGGPTAALEAAKDVLDTLGRLTLHVGERSGSGLVMKLAVNLQVAIQEVAFGEALGLAESCGVDRSTATEVMMQSVIASPMLKYRVPFLAEPPEEIWASAEQLRKDVGYAVERTCGTSGAGAVARALLDLVVTDGRGDREAVELIAEAAMAAADAGASR